MSTSRGEDQPTGTSGRESTNKKSWSNHVHSKWFVDWRCAKADEPTTPPCGPVIFVEDRKGRRVLGSVKGWQAGRNHDKQYYIMHMVYNSKSDVVGGSKGAILKWDLFQGFGAGALRTPFYYEIAEEGLVSAREFFDMVEQSDVDLEQPCEITTDLQLSVPLQMCTGFESSGAPTEGGDLGSGSSAQRLQSEERGRFDDSEEDEVEETSKSMGVVLAEGMVHILWTDSKDVTSMAPFGVEPLEAQMKVVELERAVGIIKCHTCVLDLCEPVDIKQWTPKVFESLNALLEHLFSSHWTVLAFVPHEHDYYFMTCLHLLSVAKAMAVKWTRRTQQKGNNLYSLDDRMYILFKGDDLWENTSVVYDTRLAAGDASAVGANHKVTPTEISEMPFDACEWPLVIHGSDPSAIYEFLFLERQPKRDTDIEYMRRKDHMLALLDNYHDASRLNAKNFLEHLQTLYFVESEHVLRLRSYSALIDTGEETVTGIVFDTNAPEEDSDTEEISIDYHLAPMLTSPASTSAGPSTSPPGQATPVRTSTPGRTPSKLLARLTPRPFAPPPLHPGCLVPLEHPSRKDDNIHFEGHDHTRSTEADWGHDMNWHPGTIQPAVCKGEWVMAIVDTDGEWKPTRRLAKSDYLDIASSAVVYKVTSENSHLQPADSSIIITAGPLFQELQDKHWLELSGEFYEFETSPLKGKQSGGGDRVVQGTQSPSTHTDKSAKFVGIRASQTNDPTPVDAASSPDIRILSSQEQAALASGTAFASSLDVGGGLCRGDPVSASKDKSTDIRCRADIVQASGRDVRSSTRAQASEMGAALAARETTAPTVRDGSQSGAQEESGGSEPPAFLATKSAGIRTSSETAVRSAAQEESGGSEPLAFLATRSARIRTSSETAVWSEDDRSLGSAFMPA
ncbi:hypothetical protein CBR_g31801 [Chara braunii]|uniref:Uncharacterized protein n=1 Tax=Chara braunii TaxID=69332 RepID=A0A388LFN7_CHABU|nr:hypothetical protein CBR_g31801 [Chara braunii]|eukprot:GBG81125.1 hypothetical protein CBR_g31801 [Chara braunii]